MQSGGKEHVHGLFARRALDDHGADYVLLLIFADWTTSKPAADPLDYLSPTSSRAAPPPSPLQQALSPLTPPCLCLTPTTPERQTGVDTKEEGRCPGGCLEGFLESTAGETLLGAEPDGLLSLIDDLYSQMCAPPSSGDASSTDSEEEHELDLTVEGARCNENSTLGPLLPPPPSSVFSTDFLDNFDLQTLMV